MKTDSPLLIEVKTLNVRLLQAINFLIDRNHAARDGMMILPFGISPAEQQNPHQQTLLIQIIRAEHGIVYGSRKTRPKASILWIDEHRVVNDTNDFPVIAKWNGDELREAVV